MKTKTVTLKQIGWRVEGEATCYLWGGGEGTIDMDSTFIPLGKMTKGALHRAINDGRFGCEMITEATLYVAEAYGNGYTDNWREIIISNPNHNLVKRGV